MPIVKRHRTVVDETPLATRIGERIRVARHNSGLTQMQLAEGRYTKAYISALEKGHAKPSVAALNFIAERLNMPAALLPRRGDAEWSRLRGGSARGVRTMCRTRPTLTIMTYRHHHRGGSPWPTARGKAEALCRLGHGLEAIKPATEAVEIFQSTKHDHDSMLAGYWLAYAQYLSENMAEARSILRSLLDRVRAGLQIDPDLEMRLLTAASYVEAWEGKHQAAVAYLEEARALTTDMDGRRRAASFLRLRPPISAVAT